MLVILFFFLFSFYYFYYFFPFNFFFKFHVFCMLFDLYPQVVIKPLGVAYLHYMLN